MKTGRPKNNERRRELVHVGFKADDKTMVALDVIVKQAKRQGVVAPKSTAIRRAIVEAAERVNEAVVSSEAPQRGRS